MFCHRKYHTIKIVLSMWSNSISVNNLCTVRNVILQRHMLDRPRYMRVRDFSNVQNCSPRTFGKKKMTCAVYRVTILFEIISNIYKITPRVLPHTVYSVERFGTVPSVVFGDLTPRVHVYVIPLFTPKFNNTSLIYIFFCFCCLKIK